MNIVSILSMRKNETDVIEVDRIQETWDILMALRKKLISNKDKYTGFESMSEDEYRMRHDEIIHQVEITASMYNVMISDEIDW